MAITSGLNDPSRTGPFFQRRRGRSPYSSAAYREDRQELAPGRDRGSVLVFPCNNERRGRITSNRIVRKALALDRIFPKIALFGSCSVLAPFPSFIDHKTAAEERSHLPLGELNALYGKNPVAAKKGGTSRVP